ncbi:AMP-binding protein [Streptomyces sp. SID13031]|uniref:AMP-dependent synthetase/ligase n=1 Tax=Streptomyces sp. SID13031 TaxID=2706046 RepID=UPI0013CC35C5|nr:AMP-binding protein [Streptomyces sp. SID13031]NEA36754.1 long-chain fatty acid--CoA ligase [Streptomyces sp. SID13031]
MSTVTAPVRPATIATRVRDRAVTTPNLIALREKDLGLWQQVSWSQYWLTAELVGHALLALGIEPGDRVAIHSENRREWLYTDIGAVSVRAVTVGLYPTNPVAEVAYLLRHSGTRVLIAEDQEQVDKALAVADELPDLERIVYLEPRGIRHRYDDPRLLAWPDFLALGTEHRESHPGAVDERMGAVRPDDVATLVYTSGTTGPPKGVMLTVANVDYAIQELVERGGFASPPPSSKDSVLSYLPLCHVAERVFSCWFGAGAGVCVHFAESIETVAANLHEVQPSVLFGVPRIWEKIAAGVQIRIGSAGLVKRSVGGFWLRRADWIGSILAANGGKHTAASRLVHAIGYVVCYRALLDRVGLRKVRYAASGAAPIAPEVLRFFMGLGLPMHEVYGMTENSAVATANRPGRVKLGTVGERHAGVELRIDETTGEILTRHAGTFAGYWHDPEATERVLDPDGWLHTGDVGEWVDGTHLRITDRMKDLIITAGGKNVAPSELENALKASPYIKEVVVIGDRRKYLTALIGIEPDTVGHWAQLRRLPYSTYGDLASKAEVVALVQGIVDEINARFATVEQVKSFRLLPKLLEHEDGELTATQKVKRGAVTSAFAELVESMYRGGVR